MTPQPRSYSFFRRTMQRIFRRPVTWLANAVSSAPERENVFKSLSEMYAEIIQHHQEKKGTLYHLDDSRQRIIIFSDQHKGKRNGADDFAVCEQPYIDALNYYNDQQYFYINLGDSEELWENNIFSVIKFNGNTFAAEQKFADRFAYCKIYGNHDSFWRFDPLAPVYLKQVYGKDVTVYGGIVLRYTDEEKRSVDILCTHGHQGDKRSDGSWFSAAVVTYIWGPLQAYLDINTNLPSDNPTLKTRHNAMMYEWSSEQKNTLLITGHTHQPVFNSLTHLERLLLQRMQAEEKGDRELIEKLEKEIPQRRGNTELPDITTYQLLPTYFNTGCCCFANGVITGIEIDHGKIRLVKWHTNANGKTERTLLEENSLQDITLQLSKTN